MCEEKDEHEEYSTADHKIKLEVVDYTSSEEENEAQNQMTSIQCDTNKQNDAQLYEHMHSTMLRLLHEISRMQHEKEDITDDTLESWFFYICDAFEQARQMLG